MFRRLNRVLDSLADEGHRSELVAGVYHAGFVVLYVGALMFHLWAAGRHWRAAKERRR